MKVMPISMLTAALVSRGVRAQRCSKRLRVITQKSRHTLSNR